MKKNLVVIGLLAVAAAVLAGCGSSGSSTNGAARSYVGRAEGTNAFVAVVADGAHVLAYVCDGVPADPVGSAPTVQEWFNGSSDGRTVDLRQSTARLQLTLTGTAMTGRVTLAGQTFPVAGAVASGDAGLYRTETSGGTGTAVAGWILSADGMQRGGLLDGGKLSGTTVLNTSRLTFSLQGVVSSQIAKVGITPIPIP